MIAKRSEPETVDTIDSNELTTVEAESTPVKAEPAPVEANDSVEAEI